jgi:hypothetical protein
MLCETFRDLLVEELAVLLSAESRVAEVFPTLDKIVYTPELRDALAADGAKAKQFASTMKAYLQKFKGNQSSSLLTPPKRSSTSASLSVSGLRRETLLTPQCL